MTAVEGGDFEDGIRLMNRILAVRGQVVPVSPTPLTLHARLADGSVVDGQSQIMRTSRDRSRVADARRTSSASDDALAAIAEAELIVLGPGSLYTSLLPSLLIPAIRDAVAARAAPRVFVCNVATQDGETTGFDLAAHVEALVAHTEPGPRRHRARQQPASGGVADAAVHGRRRRGRPTSVRAALAAVVQPVPRLVLDDVVDPDNAHHHDPARLAAALIRALRGRGRHRAPADRAGRGPRSRTRLR